MSAARPRWRVARAVEWTIRGESRVAVEWRQWRTFWRGEATSILSSRCGLRNLDDILNISGGCWYRRLFHSQHANANAPDIRIWTIERHPNPETSTNYLRTSPFRRPIAFTLPRVLAHECHMKQQRRFQDDDGCRSGNFDSLNERCIERLGLIADLNLDLVLHCSQIPRATPWTTSSHSPAVLKLDGTEKGQICVNAETRSGLVMGRARRHHLRRRTDRGASTQGYRSGDLETLSEQARSGTDAGDYRSGAGGQ